MNITENGRIFIPELENQLLFFIENDGAYIQYTFGQNCCGAVCVVTFVRSV